MSVLFFIKQNKQAKQATSKQSKQSKARKQINRQRQTQTAKQKETGLRRV